MKIKHSKPRLSVHAYQLDNLNLEIEKAELEYRLSHDDINGGQGMASYLIRYGLAFGNALPEMKEWVVLRGMNDEQVLDYIDQVLLAPVAAAEYGCGPNLVSFYGLGIETRCRYKFKLCVQVVPVPVFRFKG